MARRYQRGNQNPYIEEEQTTQWPKDIKGAIRIRISKKNKQHNGQKISKGQSESVYRRRTNNTMAKRYQRGNQNPYIEEEQTTQWSKEKGQKYKQRSTKHAYKTKDRVTRTPLKTGGKLRCSGRVGSSCSTSGTRRVIPGENHQTTVIKLITVFIEVSVPSQVSERS
jgi:hypothetical protein